MPNLRASYEAEAMTPRFSPPTAMGLPRNRGSAVCSTEAKKASASRWTMERGIALDVTTLTSSSYQSHHDALDLRFFLWDKVGVAGVFGAQIGFASLQDECFESDLAINEGGDHIAGTRLHAVLNNGDVAINNVFAEHRIALDLEAEGSGAGLDAEG